MILRGQQAAVLVGTRVAMRLGEWSARPEKLSDEFDVDAKLVSKDEFLMGMSPKYLELFVGKSRPKWVVTSVDEKRTRVVIRVHGRFGG